MKILYITDDFPPESVGGAGQVVFDSARIMQSLGNDVLVLSSVEAEGRARLGEYGGVKVNRIFFPKISRFSRAWLSPYNPFVAARVKGILSEIKPDIVHLHNVHTVFSFASAKWAKRSGAKVIFTAHDTLSFSYTRLYHFIDKENPICKKDNDYRVSWKFLFEENRKSFNPFRAPLIRNYLNKYCDRILAVSNELKKAMEQNEIKNVSVLYNGINLEDYRASSSEIETLYRKLSLAQNRKFILFGGRGMPDKGAKSVVEMIPEIKKEIPEAHLLMAIGKDDYQASLAGLVGGLGLQDSVSFIGLMHGRDLAALFGLSFLVVVPSLTMDPAPLMNMQAMAAGKPVVGTCFGGTPEIVVDGVCGYIANPHNQKEFSARIISLLKDIEMAINMGRAGKKIVEEKFSLEKYGERLANVYNF